MRNIQLSTTVPHLIVSCRIWNTYKDSYARHRKQELRIIE